VVAERFGLVIGQGRAEHIFRVAVHVLTPLLFDGL